LLSITNKFPINIQNRQPAVIPTAVGYLCRGTKKDFVPDIFQQYPKLNNLHK